MRDWEWNGGCLLSSGCRQNGPEIGEEQAFIGWLQWEIGYQGGDQSGPTSDRMLYRSWVWSRYNSCFIIDHFLTLPPPFEVRSLKDLGL